MQLNAQLRQRLAREYNTASTKMQEEAQLTKKLFYFSVFFGEAQRILNQQWDRDLALIFLVTQQAYTQFNVAVQTQAFKVLPIRAEVAIEQLTKVASDLAAYTKKAKTADSRDELCEILGRFAELTYAVGGNGSYLYEKGDIKF